MTGERRAAPGAPRNVPPGRVSSGRPSAPLTRLGLTGSRTEETLATLGWWAHDAPVPGAADVMWALARSPDPDLALRAVDRLAAADAREWKACDTALRHDVVLRGRLFAVLGGSTALGDHLVTHPDRWRRLTAEAPDPIADVDARTATLLAAVGADPAAPPAGSPGGGAAALRNGEGVVALRTAYRDELLVLAAADLAAVSEPALPVLPLEEVAAQLADLASAALRAALAVALADVSGDGSQADGAADGPWETRLAVIAMGKTGGAELNYVSDVDVVFVGEPSGPEVTRLASRMMRVAGEACFPVDANLRPEGRQGALVRTLEGHVAYYQRWAKTWEFQALLKARPVAGDPELGAAYAEAVAPMIWTAAGRPDFVADVQGMRRRVEEHVRPDHADRELKLGRGGLRDVEFAVQLLQLVHGRADPALRSPTTLDALAALADRGYVGRDDGANLAASYRFLRLLEHRLQLQRMRRTHLLPAEDDTDALRWLARAAKLRPDGRHDAVGVLLEEWRRNARRVRRLHEKLFYRPLLDAASRLGADTGLSPEAATVRLGALGWASPEGALTHIRALTGGVSRAAAIQRTLLPVLLDELARTPDPDRGLLAYRRVSEALARTPWYLRLLRDEGLVAERLMTLLGTSALVPDLLVRAPEVLRLLAAPAAGQPDELTRDPANSAATLRAAVGRQPDPHAAATTARSARRHEMLRIACADLLGKADVEQVCVGLSALWVAVLQAVLASALRALGGATPPARIAVIGMGRLGGAELGYGSDADVLFVGEPTDGATDREAVKFAITVVETVRRQLGAPSPDPPLVVDADLRPEGRGGPLVRTLASYREYYARWSEPWEAQALLRARAIGGDAELGRRFIEMIDQIRYPDDGITPTAVTEIRRIKARVDAERLPRGADRATHTKLGLGGLADVEWTVQLLQLQHAGDIPELRTTATLNGLREAAEAELISHEDADELAAGWMMATRARNAVMLVRGRPGDQLPRSGRELAAVAAALGYPADGDPGVFLDDYRRATRRSRAVVERVFYGW